MAVCTPYDAKKNVIKVLTGWLEYFKHSMAATSFSEVLGYANDSIRRMNRRWHNKDHIGKYRNHKRMGLIIDHKLLPKLTAYNAT